MRTPGSSRHLLVALAVVLLISMPMALAQNATQDGNQTAANDTNETGGNQTSNQTGGNETDGNQTAGNETDGGQAGGDQPSLEGPPTYTIDVALGEAGASLTIHPAEITVPPGAEVTFHVVNVGNTDHDFALLSNELFEFSEDDLREREDGGEAVKTPLLAPGESHDLTVTFNDDASGTVTYICSVPGHRSGGMEGAVTVGAAAGGGEEEITDFGVDYLAYWVGIISFVIIFVVLFGTFFLFRYGESKHVADHRTGGPQTVTVAAGTAEGEGEELVEPILPSPRSVATVLAILALIGAAFYFLL